MKRITSFLLAIVLFAGLVLTAAPVAYAASEMTVSDALVGVLKKEEGFSAKPYWDYGQYTVGYGTRCPDDMLEEYQENGITEKEAETLLRNYLAGTENTINKKFIDKYGLTLTQGQFDALVTFTYNVGTSWISDTSGTFHNAVKNGATGSELIRAFSLWCNAGGSILPGLVRRRLCEANMFLNEEYSIKKPDNYCYVYYNANGGSVSYRIQGYDANEGVAPAYKATYSGHEFLGWYTAKTGGEKVTKLTSGLSGTTLYARWNSTEEENTTTVPTEGVKVVVTGSNVNLRKGPGTNYTIVGTANKGDELMITETASGSGYEWGNADGKWIALQYTNYDEAVKEQENPETTEPETTEPETTEPETTEPETTEPETTEPEPTTLATSERDSISMDAITPASPIPAPAVTGTVKANGGLAVREGPGTGYAVIKYLSNGSKVTITEQQTVGSMTWGKIDAGWISMSYVVLDEEKVAVNNSASAEVVPDTAVPETVVPQNPEEPAVELTGKVKVSDALSVRKGPGTSYAVKKYLKNGTKVTITEVKDVKGTKWGKISSGWVCMDYVVLDEEEAADMRTVTADCLNVRKDPKIGAKIVGYYYEGARVEILETRETDGSEWGRTAKGWISMKYVK